MSRQGLALSVFVGSLSFTALQGAAQEVLPAPQETPSPHYTYPRWYRTNPVPKYYYYPRLSGTGSYLDTLPGSEWSNFYPPRYEPPLFYPRHYSGGYEDQPEVDTSVHLNVKVPPQATVWFDGQKTAQTGPLRAFHSPPLEPGFIYQYEIRAVWMEEGRSVEQIRQVPVRPGESLGVEFLPATGTQLSPR